MAKNIVIIILVILLAAAGYYAWDQQRAAEDTEEHTLSMKEAVAAAEAKRDELRASLTEAERKLEEARSSLEERIKSLQGDIASRDELIDSIRDQLDSVEGRVAEYRERIASALSDKESLEQKVSALTSSLANRDEQLGKLRAELAAAQDSFQEARRNLTRLREQQRPDPGPDPEEVADGEVLDALPVIAESQGAGFLGTQRRVTIRNTSDRSLTLSASFARDADAAFTTTEVTVAAGGTLRLEGDRNRNFLPGDRITLNHPDYLPLEYRVP